MRCLQIIFFIAFFNIFFNSTGKAQLRTTETEVDIQKIFIDALKEKQIGNLERAQSLLSEVLKKDPGNAAAMYERAQIFSQLEEWEKGLEAGIKATELDPQNVWYQMLLADLYNKTGQFSKAGDIYGTLSKKDPGNASYYSNWAYFLVRSGNIQEAIKAYDNLELRHGISEEIIRQKHALYVGLGNPKKAAGELKRLADAYPSNADYKLQLAEFYEQMGDNKASKETYQQILATDPNNSKASMAIKGTEKFADEVQYLHNLKELFAKPEVDIDLKIKQLMPFVQKVAETGDTNLGGKAGELGILLIASHPGEAKAYAVTADLQYYSGNRQEALANYQKTLELDASVFQVWEQLMNIYHENHDYLSLIRVSDEAIDLFPNQPLVYYKNAIAASKLLRFSEALTSLEHALLMTGKNPLMRQNILAQMGWTYFLDGNIEKSEQRFEEAMLMEGANLNLVYLYAMSLLNRNQHTEKAKLLIAEALKLAPSSPAALEAQAWFFYKHKDYLQAKDWIIKAMAGAGGTDPSVLEHAGDIYYQLGDKDAAMQYWMKAKEKNVTSLQLGKKIEERKLIE